MGGSKKSTSNETVNTSTTTTAINGFAFGGSGAVSIGDIGLTGKDAVGLVAVLGQTTVETERIHAAKFDALIQTAGSAYSQLIAGAGNLVVASAAVQQSGFASVNQLGARAVGAEPTESIEAQGKSFDKMILLLGGAAALFTIVSLNRKAA